MIEDAGRRALALPGDIRSEEHCRALVESTVESFGGLDILVNNAAYQMATPGGIADISTEQFDRVMKTNLYALFWLCKFASRSCGRLHDHQHILHPGHQPITLPDGLRHHQSRIVDFTKALADDVAVRGFGSMPLHRADLDTAHPGHDATRAVPRVRQGCPARQAGAARRTRARVRVLRLARIPLHHW